MMFNFPVLYLQMMLERRTNQGMLKLIQPKDCVEKSIVTYNVENGSVIVNGCGDVDHVEKTQCEKSNRTNNLSLHAGVPKPGPVNVTAPPALEKTSSSDGPLLGKVTYNPITHAPSMFEFVCSGSMHRVED